MLTLTRKVGQKILIGDNIEVVVREVRGRQVRLGIVAPTGTPVYREELYEQLAAEAAAEAAGSATTDPTDGDPPPPVGRDDDDDGDGDG